jgi:pyruvate dehydrogenase E2 component (dihydrolipoamide acetyltransferase)
VAQEFKLPDLGEGIESGDVVKVLVSEGDTISAEQTVLEIETDKAVLEVPCPFGGKVTKVHVSQGDSVSVGSTLISVDANGASADSSGKTAEDTDKKKDTEKKSEQKKPAKPEPEAAEEKESKKEEPRSEKTPTEKTEPRESEPTEKKPRESETPKQATATGKSSEISVPAGPATRRLARELGIDLTAMAIAYPDARLTPELVKEFVREGKLKQPVGAAAPGGAALPAVELPDFSRWGEIERKSLTKLQSVSADHLAAAWVHVPHVTQFDEADVGALEKLRKRFKDTEQGKQVKLTVTAFVLKACAIALRTYPQCNASIDHEAGELILKKYIHIGMAVDTEAGLIVPVIRDVDRKRVVEIAREITELANRTRDRKVGIEELRGGTFTVTNLGGIGGTAFTPIVNHPEVAILGLSRTREAPVVDDEQLSTKQMLPLCLSYDHRVINGADGARFIRKVVTLLEDPEMLLLEG